jgi:hypothetical protein
MVDINKLTNPRQTQLSIGRLPIFNTFVFNAAGSGRSDALFLALATIESLVLRVAGADENQLGRCNQ